MRRHTRHRASLGRVLAILGAEGSTISDLAERAQVGVAEAEALLQELRRFELAQVEPDAVGVRRWRRAGSGP